VADKGTKRNALVIDSINIIAVHVITMKNYISTSGNRLPRPLSFKFL